MASEFEAPKTYWDPYSRTQKPVLTQAQVDSMWPNARKENKERLRANPMDDAMPNLPPGDPTKPREAAVHFEWPLDAGVPTDNTDGQLELFEGMSPRMQQVTALNLMTAQSRLGDLPEAARSKVAEGMSPDGTDMVNLPPHYARFKIEPIRFIGENKLDWFQGNIVKYSLRWDAKNGVQDIDKVIRTAQMYRLYILGDPDWWKAGKPEDFTVG